MSDKTLLILNGPGLSELAGHSDLSTDRIREVCTSLCDQLGLDLDFRQADGDESLIRFVDEDSKRFDALIVNPGNYPTDGSDAIDLYRLTSDIVAQQQKPVVEVHLANVFRQAANVLTPTNTPNTEIGFVCGFGVHGYLLAIKAVHRQLGEN